MSLQNEFVQMNLLCLWFSCQFIMSLLSLWQCDLLDMPAVAQLEKDDKYASVYQLLKIFLTRTLSAYLDFNAANSTLMKGYGK